MTFPKWFLVPVLTAAAVTASNSLEAQRIDPTRIFDLTLQTPEQVMSASVLEGGTFRLTVHETTEYEITPVLAQGGSGRVTIAVHRSEVGDPATRRLAERMEMEIGTAGALRTVHGWHLVVDRIRNAAVQQAAPARTISFSPGESLRRAMQDDSCCVCCGGVCACGCGVKMSCGSCCMPSCCASMPAEPASNPGGPDDERRRAVRMAALVGAGSCEQTFPAAAVRIASAR